VADLVRGRAPPEPPRSPPGARPWRTSVVEAPSLISPHSIWAMGIRRPARTEGERSIHSESAMRRRMSGRIWPRQSRGSGWPSRWFCPTDVGVGTQKTLDFASIEKPSFSTSGRCGQNWEEM